MERVEKSASRVGKNLKMLIESTRLFGTQEYVVKSELNLNQLSTYVILEFT